MTPPEGGSSFTPSLCWLRPAHVTPPLQTALYGGFVFGVKKVEPVWQLGGDRQGVALSRVIFSRTAMESWS